MNGNSTTTDLTRRQQAALMFVALGALAIRCIYLWGQARNNPFFDDPMMDPLVHHQWAEQIASGKGMGDTPYFRAPLYYYSLGLLYWIAGPRIWLARLAGCLLGAGSCYLLGRLSATLGGFRTGLIAAAIAAVYWPFIYFDGELLTVGLEVFLNIALLLLLEMAIRRSSLRVFFMAGIVWGLAALTRPNILAFAPAVFCWLWIAPIGRRSRNAVVRAAVIGIGITIAILPVTIRNRIVGGEWVLIATNGGVNFYIGNNPRSDGVSAVVPGTRKGLWEGYDDTHRIADDALGRKATEREVSDFWYGQSLKWIRSDPWAWAKHLFHKLRLFWSPVEIPNNISINQSAGMSGISALFVIGFPVVACVGAAGALFVRRDWKTWSLPAAFLLTYTATVVAFFCNARYRLPVAPVLILFAAAGIDSILRRLSLATVAAFIGWAGCFALLVADNPPKRSAFQRNNDEAKWNLMLGNHYASIKPPTGETLSRAIECFQRAVELTPGHPESLISLGQALLVAGKQEEALRCFDEAVRRNPEHAEARLDYGVGLTMAERYDEAEHQCRAALRLAPTYAEAHAQLGLVLARLGRRAEAMHHLRMALEIRPDLSVASELLVNLQD